MSKDETMKPKKDPAAGKVATPRRKREPEVSEEFDELDVADDSPSDNFMHSQILGAIIERRLPAGTKLPEESLAQAFGVSRTRVRKVLNRLVLEKIVVLTRNKGASVAEPDLNDLREVFSARRLVEVGPVRMLCQHAQRDQIDELKQLVAQEEQARLRGDTVNALKLSGGFHLKIAQAAGNRIVADLLGVLISRTTLLVSDFHPDVRGLCDIHDHQRIFQAIESGDANAAVQLMDEHLLAIEQSTQRDRDQVNDINLVELFSQARE